MATKSLLFVLGVLQFVLLLKGVTSVQRFEKQPSYTEVNPGQNVELSCKVYNKKGSCSWQKDNKPVGMYLHKYEWSGSHEAGDCSLLIRVAQLEFDDGFWECQVTASDFTTQDALTSQPVRLVVRVPPQQPRIEYNGSQVLPGHNLTSLHGDMATIKCVARYGNPPAVIKWFLDQNEITPTRSQTNSTELDNPRTWVAISLLELAISKENHGKTLRCVALHESYSTRSSSVEVRLNVMFVPESRLIGIPTHDIEELKDSVAVRCVVTANPRATVIWRRAGQTQPAALQELLQFSPAVRQHAGLYTCSARNQAGEAQPVTVHIDVKYSPKILSVGPDRLTTAPLFTPATFECIAEGNPQPTYQWLQRLPTPSDVIVERGRESKLHIANVTYDYQGEYVCKVTNVISGMERTVQSEAIALQVVGAPQVLRQSTTHEIRVEKGENAMLSLVVCADPRPQVVAWEWGSYRLEAGSEHGRYRVDDVTQDDREDCYVATLHIDAATATDSRAYYLAVENDKGTDRHAVQLYVNEPLQMSTLVSIAGGCLAVFLLLVCACVYAIRSEKCCFARKGDFKPSDLDSEKLDLEKNATGPGGIPADAIYTTTPGSRSRGSASSPEVMKHPTLTYKTSSGFIEDRLSDVISGVETRQKSRTLPTRPADENRETDNETETGFRISRHLIGADNRNWDVNRYCTIQNQKTNDKCILPHETYSDLATDNHYERNATRYRSNKPNQTLAKLNKSGVVTTTSAMITTTTSAATTTTTTPTTATNQKSHRPKPFQVHDNERYYNHVFSLKPQRSLTKNIYCNDYFQPDSLDRAEI